MQALNIDTYYAVHFWRVVTPTRMDTSYRFQPFFIPHVCAVRAVRWRKLKGGASSVVHLWRDDILSSVFCAFTVVIHCSKKTASVKIPKQSNIQKIKVKMPVTGVLPLLELYLKAFSSIVPSSQKGEKLKLVWQLQPRNPPTNISANLLHCPNSPTMAAIF